MTSPINQAAQTIESVRDLDPNVSQRNASNPLTSAWVSASAGTGKTKVLTDRVLRLLLPRDTGETGTKPHRILCLTYTKAAASEMALRINDTLGKWAILEKSKLAAELEILLGHTSTPLQLEKARQLFAQVIDTPGGLKIMTIHSFCQSVLGRFPLEAGLPPYFDIMEETDAATYMKQAQTDVLSAAQQNPDSDHGKALHAIATIQNEEQFTTLLTGLCSERAQLKTWLENNDVSSLYQLFSIPVGYTKDEALQQFNEEAPREKLYELVRAVTEHGTPAAKTKVLDVKTWLEAGIEDDYAAFKHYASYFLTNEDEPRKGLPVKAVLTAAPHTADIVEQETARIQQTQNILRALDCIFYTTQLLTLGQAILERYSEIKRKHAVLDYDDLILKTRDLLRHSKERARWVLYKLDGGLSHILIDEAQDTNPEQWDIIDDLCGDFFSGQSSSDETRTIFTVGDIKQSIYSFQRAAPQQFEEMRHYFADKVRTGGAQWTDESMTISFRSTQTILDLVDHVFADATAKQGLGDEPLAHQSFRRGQAGTAEIWPPFKSTKAEAEEPWAPPVTIQEQKSGAAQLADHIGETVKNWLENGEIIESTGLPITAGDIMILVRTRTAFVGQIMRALKTRDIPVSGVDRMVLGNQIAVMDLLAMMQFCLLPEDDLTLATILKSPLIGLDEDSLYDIAIKRTGSLWTALQGKEKHKEITSYLRAIIDIAKTNGPYGFLTHILKTPCPADKNSGLRAITKRLGPDAHDPLDELLNSALQYEQKQLPSLQGFLSATEQNPVTIKREMEEAGNAVRIMTVHGSKGLQAPIVILPDTFITSAARSTKVPKLLWPDKSNLAAPLFMPSGMSAPELYNQARTHVQDKADEENRRLLYVAMTRAEDRLYIGGHIGLVKPHDYSWYYDIERGFQSHAATDEFEFHTSTNEPTETDTADENSAPQIGLRLHHHQTAALKEKKQSQSTQGMSIDKPPEWLFSPAPEEPHPPRPLTPSRPSDDNPAANSPLSKDDPYRFKRGNITHMLLQILPDITQGKRKEAARLYLAKPSLDLPTKMQNSILNETFAILEHPDFAPLFGAGSMAEVSLTGLVGNKLVSAQIDRLLITKDRISIIDYKTNRPPPTDPADIPEIYTNQMSSYKDIVAKIYNCPHIDCYLLWTDGPHIMKVPL